jgi:hypothetical protein
MLTINIGLDVCTPTAYGRLSQQDDWLPCYTYRKELTIPAGAVTADLTEQPVVVTLAGDPELAAHAQADGSDIVFTGADGATVLDFEVPRAAKNMLVGDGAWNWYTRPSVLRYGDKTYIGVVTSNGYIYVASYDHVTKTQATSGSMYSGQQFQIDDHDYPALLALSDGKIAAFYQHHNGLACYRITSSAEDITAWNTEKDWTSVGDAVHHAYCCPFRMTGESNKIYAFFRGGTIVSELRAYMAWTTEAGLAANSWNAVKWLETGQNQPYALFESNGSDEIHCIFTESGAAIFAQNSVYYCKHTMGKWYKADGTEIGSDDTLAITPITPAVSDKVYDYQTSGRAAIYDIALDGGGRPVIVYAVFPGSTASEAPDHRYRYARWTGSAWVDHEITPAGTGISQVDVTGKYYSGGVHLDHSNPNIVYLSRNNTEHGSGVFAIEKWITADDGATWSSTRIADSGFNIRPMFSYGATTDQPLSLMWMTGTYPTYTTYSTSIVTSPALDAPRLSWLQYAVVKVPSITVAGGAKLYMYYGRANPPDMSNRAGVWSGASYAFHGHDYDLGNRAFDSAHGTSLQKYRIPTAQEVAGKIGRAIYFPSIGIVSPINVNLADVRKLTVIGCVKSAGGTILSNHSGVVSAIFFCRINLSSHKLEAFVKTSMGTDIVPQFEATVLDANTWHHFAIVFDCDNGGLKAWIDGVQSPTVAATANPFHPTASSQMNLGYSAHNGVYMTGAMEAIRMYVGAAWTPAQIKADYDSIFSPEAFLLRGVEELL